MTILVSFKLPSEFTAHATGGIILGEFNNWDPAQAPSLSRHEDGSLQAEIELTAGKTYQYKYLLNDGRWVNDASQTTWTDFSGTYVENSIVEVLEKDNVQQEEVIKTQVKARRKAVKTVKTIIADDLTMIDGINKKISALLKKNGIITYSQLSKAGVKKITTLLEANNIDLKKYDPSGWSRAAKELNINRP